MDNFLHPKHSPHQLLALFTSHSLPPFSSSVDPLTLSSLRHLFTLYLSSHPDSRHLHDLSTLRASLDSKDRTLNELSTKLQLAKDSLSDAKAQITALKNQRKLERKHISETVMPRLKYLEAFTKKLQGDKARLQSIHESKSMSIEVTGGRVKPQERGDDIGLGFEEMIREGYVAQIERVSKENSQWLEVIEEMHRGVSRMVKGISKESCRTIAGVRGIIQRIEELKNFVDPLSPTKTFEES